MAKPQNTEKSDAKQTDAEAARIIEELLLLLMMRGFKLVDDGSTTRALGYLMQTRREHPNHPITESIFEEMRKRGYTDPNSR